MFVGKDVAQALGYSNTRKALQDHVDEEDKGVTKRDTLGGTQKMTIINESGLYALILSSCTHRRSALPLATVYTAEPTPCVQVVVFIACCVPAFVIKGGALFFSEPDT